MGAQSAIVLADAAGSPVNHTFNPLGLTTNDAKGAGSEPHWFWRASDFGYYVDGTIPANLPPVGYPTIELMVRRPKGQNRNYKISYWFAMPALDPVSGVSASGYQPPDRAANVMMFKAEATVNERVVPALRYHFHKMAVKPLDYTLGAGAPFYDALHDLTPPW